MQREEKEEDGSLPRDVWDGIRLSIIDGADHVINGQVEQREPEHLL